MAQHEKTSGTFWETRNLEKVIVTRPKKTASRRQYTNGGPSGHRTGWLQKALLV